MVGLCAALLAGIIAVVWVMFSHSGNDERANHDDTVRIHELAYQFFDAIGSGESQVVKDLSCEGGLYEDADHGMLEVLKGMKVVSVDETLNVEKPVTIGTVFFNYEQNQPLDIEPADRDIRSQRVTFKYADGAWCVWG